MAAGLDVSLVSLKKNLSHVTATVLVQFCNYLFDTSLFLCMVPQRIYLDVTLLISPSKAQ